MSNNTYLVADIGGTNARFAIAGTDEPGYLHELTLQCKDYVSIQLAISAYLEQTCLSTPERICIAAAGPVIANTIHLTNNHWHIKADELKTHFAAREVHLLNDFAAIACSLTSLQPTHCEMIGSSNSPDLNSEQFHIGVMGPGTGLGAATLLRRYQHTMPIVTEAGHSGFAPETQLQQSVWNILQQRFGRVSDERILSGAGIENVYSALSELHQEPAIALSAAEIFAQHETNTIAADTIKLFFEVLGQTAGNFVLSTGAFDGLYIAGGIAQRYPGLLANSNFRAAFENKGRHRPIMENVPTILVRHPNPGLLGAAAVASHQVS
ncbi:MAG: glucokinase [Pseudomonadales bacterium]